MNSLEIKFQSMTRAQKVQWLHAMDTPTQSEDLKIDEIIEVNEKGHGFAPYRVEQKMIKRMVRKGLVIDTIHGVYAVQYLCNL